MPERQPKATSAFSRLATYVPNINRDHSGSSSNGSGSTTASKASNALEALVSADGRVRMASSDRAALNVASDGPRRSSSDRDTAPAIDSPVYGTPDLTTTSWAQRQVLQAGGSGYWGADIPPHPSTSDSAYSLDAPSSTSSDHYLRTSASSFISHRERLQNALASSTIPENHQTRDSRSRARRELSRSLKLVVAGLGVGDRGMVGLAKPRDGDQARVAVAGRTYLKLLKVPRNSASSYEGPSTNEPEGSNYRSSSSTSSIAYRRSRSRGSITASSTQEDLQNGRVREDVTEELDVKLGARLGPGFLFTDVRWGHGATANKLATSCSNGAVVLWDLDKETPSRVDQLKYEHDRAVNRVVFGGASGSWLMSGGQDGQMKLWDIRESRPASLVLRASSPVRHLAFSPSAAQPFTLLAVCSSGTLVRYDIRLTGRLGGGATDRVAGHVGACLAMDWRDNLDGERGESDRGEGGWVVTGGLDNTVKVWDFSLVTLSSKPVRTLYSCQPVGAVAWHPTRSTELASSPLPSLSLNMPATTPTEEASQTELGLASGAGSWRNEIEIWDVRREYFPKLSIKTSEPVAAIIFNEDDLIWSTSKSTATFEQHDIKFDSYSPLSTFPRPSASWNIEGDIVFAEDSRKSHDIPWDTQLGIDEYHPVDAPAFRPETFIGTVAHFDPDHDYTAFNSLASNYVLSGSDFGAVCDLNADAAEFVHRADAAELWSTIKIWLDDKALHEEVSQSSFVDSPVKGQPEVLLSPPQAENLSLPPLSAPGSPGRVFGRRTVSTPLSRNRSLNQSPHSHNIELPLLPIFPEKRLSSEMDPVRISGLGRSSLVPAETDEDDLPDSTSSSSSASEQNLARRYKDLTSPKLLPTPEVQMQPIGQLATKLVSTHLGRSRSTTNPIPNVPASSLFSTPTHFETLADSDNFNLPRSLEQFSRTHSRIISSSSETDDSDADEEHISRARAAINAARQKSRRSSSNTDRRAPLTRENLVGNSRRTSDERERPSVVQKRIESMVASIVTLRPSKHDESILPCHDDLGPSMESLRRAQDAERVKQATGLIKRRIVDIVLDYAEKGDSQLCATVCCVLQHHDMGFDQSFVLRVTKAYLDLLRQARMFVAAAGMLKACAPDSLRSRAQNNVVFHAACGSCGKALEQSTSGRCQRCACVVSSCAICHRLIVTGMLVFCPICGHGAHPSCLSEYVHSLSQLGVNVAPAPPLQRPELNSYPSTPGFGFAQSSVRAWMWNENETEPSSAGTSAGVHLGGEEIENLFERCPTGTCNCRGCLLGGI